ncbi:MAG: tetratricopeptide repeat protein [Sporichthyaceae bacterium]|nr:tetratricopeptide repeat protein [Sporichthyaceae bacterium]
MTFLFTDIEGSTRLLHDLGAEGYAAALVEHRRILREAFRDWGGVEVDTQGDAFFVAFPTARGALDAAMRGVTQLAGGPVRVRMGLHTGTPLLTDEGYVGVDVHRAARIAACGHGGQVLVSTATANLVDPALLRDLGEHRLKDLSAAERIYQLGTGEFPRLKSLHQTNLPVPATPFIGREREMHELHPLLGGDHPRLVTLTGPGGTGKTRLALQAAAAAAGSFPDGVFWVPLAPVRDPGLVLATTAQALGTTDELADHIGERSMLLVLDNLEQVIAAAVDIAMLLSACPRLHVLVTSREVLGVAGEQAYPVPPFDLVEGIDFFTARARAARPDFVESAAVAQLCSRLDNLPLALELAAARTRMMTVERLVGRLGGRLDMLRAGRGTDARQQTLRATIKWSHDLLDADEQALFARLAVFVGGCTLEAAEGICDAELDVLQSLVDKSLIRLRDDGRYWMLETIREFAAESLNWRREDEATRQRHARYFLALVSGDRFGMEGLETSLDVFTEAQVEHANLLAALDHLEAAGATDDLLEMTAALSPFWLVAGYLKEARGRLERALAAEPAPTPARAAALDRLSEVLLSTGERSAARQRGEEALNLHRSLGDHRGMAESLHGLAYWHAEQGDFKTALNLYEQCLALLDSGPPDRLLIWTGRSLAWMHWQLGDLDEARRRLEAALAEARRQANRSAEATVLGALGLLAGEQGRMGDALVLSRDSMVIWRELHDPLSLGTRLGGVGWILAAAGRFEEAAQALTYSRALLAQLGADVSWATETNSKTEDMLKEHRPELDLARLQGLASEVSLEEAVGWALQVLGTGPIHPVP